MSAVITRFAPSPTGFLHIGGARTALFNWLYAKHHNGKFLLRIEDTDRKRLTKEAVGAIIEGLKWLNIDYEGEIVYQSQKIDRHIEVANLLLKTGKAYYCYCPEHQVMKQKIKVKEEGKIYKHRCVEGVDKNINPVIRLKVPDSEGIVINDKVYGQIKVNSDQFDNIIILRSDNTPTYIFAVVVDDHDAGVTDVIRGSDHLTNTFKQLLIYQALNFKVPNFAHVPLIHGEDGNKLSKRHGATSVCDYKEMGILPSAMRNYLLRLGWSHSDDEIISDEQAVAWFNLDAIGRSPARLNFKKLERLNNYYISNTGNEDLLKMIMPMLQNNTLIDKKKNYLMHGLTELKKRAYYLTEFPNLTQFYTKDLPLDLSEKAYEVIKSNLDMIYLLESFLSNITNEDWHKGSLSAKIKEFSRLYNVKMSDIYHSLRAPITGTMDTPGIIDIMIILDRSECLKRLEYSRNYIDK